MSFLCLSYDISKLGYDKSWQTIQFTLKYLNLSWVLNKAYKIQREEILQTMNALIQPYCST